MSDLKLLAAPFPASDVEWRVQSSGEKNDQPWARVLAYIDNRAIMDRLDDVCGQENWRNEYRHGPDGAVLCGISILVERGVDSEWVTKWDGAENTDIEAVKGGLSGAMKRAGYQWGIGRYLYQLEEGFAKVSENGKHYTKPKQGKPFKWDPPALPAWALPAVVAPTPAAPQVPNAAANARTDRASVDKIERLRQLIRHPAIKDDVIKTVNNAISRGLTEAKAQDWIGRIELRIDDDEAAKTA